MSRHLLHRCPYCKQLFVSCKEYWRHRRIFPSLCHLQMLFRNAPGKVDTMNEPHVFYCLLCKALFFNYTLYQNHVHKYCHSCKRTYKHSDALMRHLERYHKMKFKTNQTHRWLNDSCELYKSTPFLRQTFRLSLRQLNPDCWSSVVSLVLQ